MADRAAATLAFSQVETFVSRSGRTTFALDRTGIEKVAAEHEWMRDRIVRLELENGLLRSVIDCGARPVACAEPATV